MSTTNGRKKKKKTDEFNQLSLFEEPKVLLITDEHLNIDEHLELDDDSKTDSDDENVECGPNCGPLGNCRPDCWPNDR